MNKTETHPIECAASVLYRIFRDIALHRSFPPSTRLCERAVNEAGLSGAKAARVYDTVLGVLRWRDRLDSALTEATPRRKLNVPSLPLNLLRAAAYELVVRRKDPPYGLVNAVVDIAGRMKEGSFAGLANALLRRLSERPPDEPPGDDRPLEEFARFYSMPIEFLELMDKAYGSKWTVEMCRATGARLRHALRVNPFLESNAELPASIGAEKLDAPYEDVWMADTLSADIRKLNESGRIVIQSLPSQYASILLDPRPGERVLDAASGVGMKAHHLLALIAGWGDLTLCDISPDKRQVCLENFGRLGAPEPDYRILDLSDAGAVEKEFGEGRYDAIMLDVPCSGSGLIHHMPEKRYTLDIARLPGIAGLQRAMLAKCLCLLKPGGRLVYATCSVFPEENEIVTWPLTCDNPETFRIVDTRLFAPSSEHPGFFVEKIERLA